MGGGWHHYPLYMEMMERFLEIRRESVNKDMSSALEVCVIVDERAYAFFNDEENDEHAKPVTYNFRKTLGLMGAPYATVLASDYDSVKNDYSAFILLEPRETPLSAYIKQNECRIKVITPSEKDTTPGELREFLKECGVHVWCDRDAVIYANASYLFLHTTENARYELKLPKGKALRQIFGDPVDLSEHRLPPMTSYLFEIVEKN